MLQVLKMFYTFNVNLTYLVMKKILLLVGIIISWSYNLKAQSCDGNLPVMETFDTNNIGVCWQVDDEDGDGYNWYWRDYGSFYGGYKCLTSRSWNSSDLALTPDNWIVSYPINLTSYNPSDNIQLSWKVRGEMAALSHEFYTVYASTGNQITDFQSSSVNRGEYADEVGATGVFVTRTMDISSLAGNTVYIAFRHHNSTDQLILNIDDVTVSTSALGIEDFNKENFKFFYSKDTNSLIVKSANNPISSIKIYNILGQTVVNKTLSDYNENLNLSTLVDGIYIAQVEIDNTTKSIKFLKH